MKYELGDILPYGQYNYIIIEMSTFLDVEYLLVNKLDNEKESTDEYFIFKTNENGILLVTDKKILDVVLPIFSNKIQREVNILNVENKYNID